MTCALILGSFLPENAHLDNLSVKILITEPPDFTGQYPVSSSAPNVVSSNPTHTQQAKHTEAQSG